MAEVQVVPSSNEPKPVMPALATAAMLLALVGCCLIPTAPAAIVVAMVAMWRYRFTSPRAGRMFAVIAILIAMADLLVWSTVLWPRLKQVPGRSAQRECVNALKDLAKAEDAKFKKDGVYEIQPEQLGWDPPAGRHYSYWLAPNTSVPEKLAGGVSLGVTGKCPDCFLTAACTGQVDSDATLDTWSVSTRQRTSPAGYTIPAGEPYNDIDDVRR